MERVFDLDGAPPILSPQFFLNLFDDLRGLFRLFIGILHLLNLLLEHGKISLL